MFCVFRPRDRAEVQRWMAKQHGERQERFRQEREALRNQEHRPFQPVSSECSMLACCDLMNDDYVDLHSTVSSTRVCSFYGE